MANYYIELPITGVPAYSSVTAFPLSGPMLGALAVAIDTSTLYEWNGTNWVAIATPGAAIALDGLIGDVTATGPGVATATIQPNVVTNSKLAQVPAMTLKGNNTGSTANELDLTVSQVNAMLSSGGAGTVTSVSVVSANGLDGTVATPTTTPAITLGTSITGILQGNGTAISAATTTGTGSVVLSNSPSLVTPALDTPTALTLTNATGLPLSTGVTGTLQAAQFPALTGDVTTPGASLATTLATVNSNVGSFGSSTSIPSVTVNAKGLVTAASGNVVIAPAGTLSGTTLNSTVTGSSLISVGIITSGTWNGAVTSGFSFITSGTTYTTPSNITTNTLFKFTLVGGGGAGGGTAAIVSQHGAGGGAAGAGSVWLNGLSPSTGYTIAIGSAGAGSSGSTGGSGGNTTLTIGATTYTASAGTGGGTSGMAGGVGGSTTNLTIGITGQTGAPSSGATASSVAGSGGGTILGSGGAAPSEPATGSTNGGAGTGYGSGGAGGVTGIASATASTGGAGTQGCILVEWQN